MTSILSLPSESRPRSAEPSDAIQAESREEILRRQLAARRKAKEAAALPSKPEPATEPVASAGSSSTAGLSIKGKAREITLPERPAGLRGWDEGAAGKDNEREIVALPARPASPRRAVSEESILAYPRSPSPGRSRSPRRRYRDRSFGRNDEPDRSPIRGPSRAERDRSPDRRYSRSPRRRELLGPSPPRRDTSRSRRRSPSPTPRDRSPPPPPRRTFDNPDRLAMRQGRDFPPHPYPQHQRYDPRRNTGGPIQAEPMRGPEQRERRASPSYNAYERPPHIAGGSGANGEKGSGAGPGAGGYGYGPGRRDLGTAPPLGQQGRVGGWQNPPRRFNGPVDFEQRRLQREDSNLIVWPASPKEPYRDEEEIEADRRAARKASKAKSKSKRTKHRSRYSSASSSESDDSEDERRVKRRRDKRRRYDSSDSGSDSDVGEKRRKRRAASESDSEDDEEERRRRKRKSKSKSKSRARSMVLEGDEEWLEKRDGSKKGPEAPLSLEDLARMQKKKKEEEEEIGPILPTDTVRLQQRQRYEDMRPGEGEAMALYASNGMRIPRRGEIGIDTERIQNLEGSGYVMSGARNKKMNAMRLRKENQVINAEEKRAILNLQREEKIKREGMIVSQFRELMNTSLQRQG